MSANFVLVASYPKSGNTWTRIVLERLQRGVDRPLAINELDAKLHGILRRLAFDRLAPVNAADLLTEEMELFLPDVYRLAGRELDGLVLIKVHDAARRNGAGEWLYPPDCMPTVIYLVRHPFDVAASTAHHLGVSVEQAVEIMADDGNARQPHTRMSESLPQIFGSWSGNVESWVGNDSYRVAIARYEDLCANPADVFLRLARAAGLKVSSEEVGIAINGAKFSDLQSEEARLGFRERPDTSSKFFRMGHPGTWRGVLSGTLQDRIVREHSCAMERLGYGADGSF